MQSYFKKISCLITGLVMMAGLFFTGTAFAVQEEVPDYSGKWITYKGASFQSVTGTPTGLWHQAGVTIEGQDNVWYYGKDAALNYDTGSQTTGTLTMVFDIPQTDPTLYFDQIYETEGGTTWDKLTISIGSDELWSRSKAKSTDASGNLAWESKSIDLSAYAGSQQKSIDFTFDSVDGFNNDYLGWAIDKVIVGSSASTAAPAIPIAGTTGANLTINQLENGNFPQVDMFVTVKDQNGDFVSGLDESNFKLWENANVIDPLTVNQIGSQASLSIALAVDASGSMGSSGIASAKAAVKDFVDMSTGAKDEFALLKFASSVTTLQTFTPDKQAIKTAMDTVSDGGMTALHQAMLDALELTKLQAGVKAVIAFTDGKNNQFPSGDSGVQDVIDKAKDYNIPVYTIGIGSVDEGDLQKIATQTGGTYSSADFNNLAQIYSDLQQIIQQQYQISFTSLSSLCDDRAYELEATLADGTVYSDFMNVPAEISNCNPPVISLHSDTKAFTQTGGAPPFGDDVEIKALVNDPDGDDIVEVNLYYRSLAAPGSSVTPTTSITPTTFSKVAMNNPASNDLYSAVIPGVDFADPGIEFYMTASDGQFTKTSNTFQIGGTPPPTSLEQIYILAPKDNTAESWGSTNGSLVFNFTKIAGAEYYMLHLQLYDVLSGLTIPLEVPLTTCPGSTGGSIWGGTTSGSCTPTPNFNEVFTGFTLDLQLDSPTWDSLSAWDITWGVEAYDSSDKLIGSTFEQNQPAKYVNTYKMMGSKAIALTAPTTGSVLDKTGSAPVFRWDLYTGVSDYTVILARVSGNSFDPVISFPPQSFNLLTMDDPTWQTMPAGDWYWTVLGADAAGILTPEQFNIFDFEVK